MMFVRKNRLGMALTLESHINELKSQIKGGVVFAIFYMGNYAGCANIVFLFCVISKHLFPVTSRKERYPQAKDKQYRQKFINRYFHFAPSLV
jgi:hypothetical protein